MPVAPVEPASIDLARGNPILNPVVELTQEGPKVAGSFVSPIVTAVTDQADGRTLSTGRGYRVGGSAAEAKDEALTPGVRGRIFADDLLSLAYPYRAAKKGGIPGLEPPQVGTQGDDSVLFSPRPIRYRTWEA